MMRYIILIVTLAILTGSCLSKKTQEDTNTPADSIDTVKPPVLESIPPDTNTAGYEADDRYTFYRFGSARRQIVMAGPNIL